MQDEKPREADQATARDERRVIWGYDWSKFDQRHWRYLAGVWLHDILYPSEEPFADSPLPVAQVVVLMNFRAPPECQWQFILAALEQATCDKQLGVLAAGPLEHLLGWHGAEFIDRIEAQAASDSTLARTITGMWKYKMTDEIWERVLALKERAPSRLKMPPPKTPSSGSKGTKAKSKTKASAGGSKKVSSDGSSPTKSPPKRAAGAKSRTPAKPK